MYFEKNKYDFVSRIHLEKSDNKAIHKILTYLYTNKISITIKTIESLLICAQELDLKLLVKLFENYLKKFDAKCSLFFLQIAKNCNLKGLYYQLFWYVINNLNECIKSTYFTEIEPSLLLDILANKSNSNRDETHIFERILKWIYANEKQSKNNVLDVLEEVDFRKVCLNDFERILVQNNFVFKKRGCSDFFRRKIKYLSS